jgi:hypothetical protein
METTIDPKIHAALELLSSVAKEKKEEVQKLVNDKYQNVKSVVSGATEATRSAVVKSPWMFLAGVASCFFLAGFLSGRVKRQ